MPKCQNPRCGKTYPVGFSNCPYCGTPKPTAVAPQPPTPPPSSPPAQPTQPSKVKKAGIIAGVLAALGSLLFFTRPKKPEAPPTPPPPEPSISITKILLLIIGVSVILFFVYEPFSNVVRSSFSTTTGTISNFLNTGPLAPMWVWVLSMIDWVDCMKDKGLYDPGACFFEGPKVDQNFSKEKFILGIEDVKVHKPKAKKHYEVVVHLEAEEHVKKAYLNGELCSGSSCIKLSPGNCEKYIGGYKAECKEYEPCEIKTKKSVMLCSEEKLKCKRYNKVIIYTNYDFHSEGENTFILARDSKTLNEELKRIEPSSSPGPVKVTVELIPPGKIPSATKDNFVVQAFMKNTERGSATIQKPRIQKIGDYDDTYISGTCEVTSEYFQTKKLERNQQEKWQCLFEINAKNLGSKRYITIPIKVIVDYSYSYRYTTTNIPSTDLSDCPATDGIPDTKKYCEGLDAATLRSEIRSVEGDYGIPICLLVGIAQVESGTRHCDGGTVIVNKDSGAIGIMQIMPDSGQYYCGYDEKDLYNVEKNIECGAKILKEKWRAYKDGLSKKEIIECCCEDGFLAEKYSKYMDWKAALRGYVGWGCRHPDYVEQVCDQVMKLCQLSC